MNNINNIVKGYSKIDLEKNYKEALKDNNFKEFVNKFKLKDEVKEKYTSSLEESYKEYSNCMNCKVLWNVKIV